MEPFTISFTYNGENYKGEIEPLSLIASEGTSTNYRVTLNGFLFGIVSRENNRWIVDAEQPQAMVDMIGDYIFRKIE